MARREKTIHERIMDWINEQPGCLCRKRWAGRAADGRVYGTAGDPDLYGSWRGRHFEIEVKQPGEGPTPRQKARLAEWRAAGAIVGVAHSLEEAQEVLLYA